MTSATIRAVLRGMPGLMLLSGAVMLPADEPGGPGPREELHLDFSFAEGGTKVFVAGGSMVDSPPTKSQVSMYGRLGNPTFQGKPLKLVTTEDQQTTGPDGQPGVLRLEFAELPDTAAYSGFVLLGGPGQDDLRLRGWERGSVGMGDLRRTFLSFRFRADNPQNPGDFGLAVTCRLEPGLPDSYPFRADFGTIIATRQWRAFRRPVSSAENLRRFLDVVNRAKPDQFKLAWSQFGPIGNYHPGDTLILDDIRVTIE